MSRRNVTHGTAIEDIFGYSTGTRYGREGFRALGTILADHLVIARPRAKARKLVAR
jgi:hypothetical protein